jgi:hypothetical protein
MGRSKGPHAPDTLILKFDSRRLRDEGKTPVILGFEKELALSYQDLVVVCLQCILDTARIQIHKVDKLHKDEARKQFYDDLNQAFGNTLDALMPTKSTLTDLAILVAEDELLEMAAQMHTTVEKLADLQHKEFKEKFAKWKKEKVKARELHLLEARKKDEGPVRAS